MELLYFMNHSFPLRVHTNSEMLFNSTNTDKNVFNVLIQTVGDHERLQTILSELSSFIFSSLVREMTTFVYFILGSQDINLESVLLSSTDALSPTDAFEVLMKRVHNSNVHCVIASNKLTAYVVKHHLFPFIEPELIKSQLYQTHSCFSRVATVVDANSVFECMDAKSDLILANTNTLKIPSHFLDGLIKNPFKLFFGLESQETIQKLINCLIIDCSNLTLNSVRSFSPSVQPEMVVVLNKPAEAVDCEFLQMWSEGQVYGFQYFFGTNNNVTIYSKRSLSTAFDSLKQLTTVDVILQTPSFDDDRYIPMVQQLQTFLIPFQLQTSVEHIERPTILLHSNDKIESWLLFASSLRKLPSFHSFDMVLFETEDCCNLITEHCNESFVYTEWLMSSKTKLPASLIITNDTLATLVLQTSSSKQIRTIRPYVSLCSESATKDFKPPTPNKLSYFCESLGDGDLAEQITQYASVLKSNFRCTVHPLHQHRSMIQMNQTFQNIDYGINRGVLPNKFSLMLYPEMFAFVFQSKIYASARQLLSYISTHEYVPVGVHFSKRQKFCTSESVLNADYYSKCIQHINQKFENKKICWIVFDDEGQDEKVLKENLLINQDQSQNMMLRCSGMNTGHKMCLFSMCTGLILSSSMFAWWSGILHSYSQPPDATQDDLICCPRRWMNINYLFYTEDWEAKFEQTNWLKVDN